MVLGSSLTIEQGLRLDHRDDAVELFWDAFKGKLGPLLGPEARALVFLRSALEPSHAISAVSREGKLLGIAGFKTAHGGFVGGGMKTLYQVYGLPGGIWRGALLSVLDRPAEPASLLMDGIFVAATARGQGVGTALIGSVRQKARELGCTSVRLDVIDSNPRARALYLRQGFVAEETSQTGLFRHVFGFQSSTRMICML